MVRWHFGAGQRLLGTLVPTPTQGLGPVTPRLGDSKGTTWGQVRGPVARPLLPGLVLPWAFAVPHTGPPASAASTSSPGPGHGTSPGKGGGTEEPTP